MEFESMPVAATGVQKITRCGKNLFDNIFEFGEISSTTGENRANNSTKNVRTKNYIKVEPLSIYTVRNGIVNNASKTRFYDKNKNYIGYSLNSGMFLTTTGQLIQTGKTPKNAYYFRFELNFSDKCNAIR